ncbi:Protein kinase C terminal domain, partial [Rhizoctonia solani]
MTSTLSSDAFVFERNAETGKIRINVPARYYLVPGVCFTTGLILGLTRGARQASLRFLAENAHRRPTTVQGWYFYKKTKNYRVMWGALKGGGAVGLKMAGFGALWVGLEQGSVALGDKIGGRTGEWIAQGREMVAGVGSAGLVLAGYRLPRPVWGQVVGLGMLGGGVIVLLGVPEQGISHIDRIHLIGSHMLKLWPSGPSAADGQLTPRASDRKSPNPFEASLTNLNPTPMASTAPRTPTVMHHLLKTQDNNHDTTPLATPSLGLPAAAPTTQLSLNPPEFKLKSAPPLRRNHSHTPSIKEKDAQAAGASSRGQLHVKLIAARGLNVSSARARPYVVVQFEQSEFVSRDPIAESDAPVRGVPAVLSRVNSAVNVTAAAAAAAGSGLARVLAANTSASSVSSGSSNGLGTMSTHNPVWKHEVAFDVTQENTTITFTVYDRQEEDEAFLGMLEMKPVLKHEHTVDQWIKLRPRESEPVTGEIRVQITYEQFQTRRALTPRDFEFLKLIGRGTFGRVFQVRKKDTKRIYAMKVLSKKEIVAKKEVAHTIGERKILQRSLESPFLVGLKFSFQTDTELYLVTDFKSGGELFWHLQRETRFSEERARFYIAELVLALEHLHKYDIVYRDLKPENILLDATGHVALCDFGLSKPDLPSGQLTNTFCGTTEYLAPEVLLDDHGYSKLVDFWSLGVLLFEMCCGWSPFYAEDTQQMYKNICFGKIRFPRGVIGEDGKQFVKGLLNRNPKHRLGAHRDAEELKEHPFFKNIDWVALAQKQVPPPFKPSVESDESTACFDPEFTSADLKETGVDALMDEDDPSDQWVASVGAHNGRPSFNGPNGGVKGMEITNKDAANKKAQRERGSPLTKSIQENFRGFTYSGESVVAAAAGVLGKDFDEDVEEEDEDEDGDDAGTDSEWEDESPAGRYSGAKRTKKGEDGFVDLVLAERLDTLRLAAAALFRIVRPKSASLTGVFLTNYRGARNFSSYCSLATPNRVMSDRHNGDYPGQVFFGVHKGKRQCIEPTYQSLMKNVQGYPDAVYKAFMNKAHADEFSKTGKVPRGAVPVQPGASSSSSSSLLSRTLSSSAPLAGPSSSLRSDSLKPNVVSMSASAQSGPSTSLVSGGNAGSSGQVAAAGSSSSSANKSGSGSKPTATKSNGGKTASLIRGTPTPVGSNKPTSVNTARNASTSASSNRSKIEVWTDGSCLSNGRENAAAAYAVYFGPDDPRNEAARAPGKQTNNVGEIYGVIRALEIVDEGAKHLVIYTDSKYTIESLGWLPGWKKRGGMNSSNKPAMNYSMIKYMDALMARRGDRVELVHVRGHQNDAGNNAADLMARAAATNPHVPPAKDWELECVNLQKKPLVSVTGSPKITAVDSPLVKTEAQDDDSDYGYSDIELDGAEIDGVDSPLNQYLSDDTRATSFSNEEKPVTGKKRARDEPVQEVPDSDTERKTARKKAKEQPVKCPSCRHNFTVTLRK